MNPYLALILSILTAYLIGSFPMSFIFVKILKGVDIRQVGSKNAGATNVLRAVGKIPALITLVVDILKGVLTVTVVVNFFYSLGVKLNYDFYRVLLGFFAICGHIWPVFLRFRGGKGVATTLGVGIVIAPLALFISLAIWLFVFTVSNYVSLASIISLIFFPIITSIFNYSVYTTISSVAISCIVIYKHKENIRRLMKGEENKVKI